MPLSRLAAARDVLIVTSTFGDGGPPDNGAGFWDRLDSPDAPALDGVRYAVLGIGDRSYDNFCGHAKSIDGRLADLGATQDAGPRRVRGLRRRADVAVGGPGRRRWLGRVGAAAPGRTDQSASRSPAHDPVLAHRCAATPC